MMVGCILCHIADHWRRPWLLASESALTHTQYDDQLRRVVARHPAAHEQAYLRPDRQGESAKERTSSYPVVNAAISATKLCMDEGDDCMIPRPHPQIWSRWRARGVAVWRLGESDRDQPDLP